MFRIFITVCFCIFFSACGQKLNSRFETITVVATPNPHALILKSIKPELAREGINLKIIEVDDYKIPNRLLFGGQIDANFFQHISYFENECLELGYDNLSILTRVHIEPMGIYSKKKKNFAEYINSCDSITVSVPMDATNEKRALNLLSSTGIISFKPGKDKEPYATKLDVVGVNRKVTIIELPAPFLGRSLQEVDFSVIPANFALDFGLKPNQDAVVLEQAASSQYTNVVVVRSDCLEQPHFKKFKELLRSIKTREFIEKEFQGVLRVDGFEPS